MDTRPIVGFGFRPTEAELVGHHLFQKLIGHADGSIKELNICDFEPKDLPLQSVFPSTDHFWYFVCPRDANADQQVRQAKGGRWKTTGKPVYIKDEYGEYCQDLGTNQIGYKHVLTFMPDKKVDDSKSKSTAVLQKNKSGKSTRKNPKQTSEWIIHEYSYGQKSDSYPYVICRLQHKITNNISGNPTDHTDLAMEIAPVNINVNIHPTTDALVCSLDPLDVHIDQSYQVTDLPVYDAFEFGESSNPQYPQVDDLAGNLQGHVLEGFQEDVVLGDFQEYDWMDNFLAN